MHDQRDDRRWTMDVPEAAYPVQLKPKSPTKLSAAVRAEKGAIFNNLGSEITLPDHGRMPVDVKPGVRFMVSSELEGDSLLDEVNKMSLEAVGDGEDKLEEGPDGGSKTPGTAVSYLPTSS